MRRLGRWVALFILCFVASGALAHGEDVNFARIWAEPDAWVLELVLDHDVATSFLAGRVLDRSQDPESYAQLIEEAQTFIKISVDGEVITPADTTLRLFSQSVVFKAWYPRTGDGHLELTHQFPERVVAGKGTVIRSTYADGSPGASVFISATHPTENVALLKEIAPAPSVSAGKDKEPDLKESPDENKPIHNWFSTVFFRLGIEHIALGFDHLLFLAGLLVACRRPRDIFAIVTSFTLAHSITLSVAALDLWVPPSSIVEPAIAASIVFVGVENLLRKEIGRERALLTFVFGLIHGFGFAGALRELGLGQDGQSIVGPLFAFNVGIEAGQLSIVALVLPGLLWLQHTNVHAKRWLQPVLSVIVALIGLYWLLQRTVFTAA